MKREILVQILSEWHGIPRENFDKLSDKELETQYDIIRSKLFGDY